MPRCSIGGGFSTDSIMYCVYVENFIKFRL